MKIFEGFPSLAEGANYLMPSLFIFMKAIEVIYEDGILKPIRKVNISEGAKLTVL